VWYRAPGGDRDIAKYPLAFPALLVPLVSLHPRLGHLFGFACLIGLVRLLRGVFRSWNVEPAWCLVPVCHPTFVVLSRTLMADLPLTLAALGAWWSLRIRRRGLAFAGLVATAALKPTGVAVAAALVAGELPRARLIARPSGRRARWTADLSWAVGGLVAGCAVAGGLNLAATGSLRYGYSFASDPTGFRLSHVSSSGRTYAPGLSLLPPGLFLGAIGLWARRELGALLAVTVLVAGLSTYGFQDRGPGWLDSVVLSQRLVLPAVAFLLLGYVTLVRGAATRLRLPPALLGFALVGVALAVSTATAAAMHRRESTMRAARISAERALEEHGGSRLGLTSTTFKAGLLSRGPVTWFVPRARGGFRAEVVLCSTEMDSWRAPAEGAMSCEAPGYRELRRVGSYRILVPG
jgi:hypothetical protein